MHADISVTRALARAGFVAAAVVLWSAPAVAQSCWVAGSTAVSFGTINEVGPTHAQGHVSVTCQSGNAAGLLRLCVRIPAGTPLAGVAPRRMSNYNGAEMLFDLYSDAQHQSIIGPPPSGGGFPTYTSTMTLPGPNSQATRLLPIFGRVPAGQILPAVQGFQSQMHNAQITWAFNRAVMPATCEAGGVTGSVSFYVHADASVSNSCRVSLASDMDFGSAADLVTAILGTSILEVRCPLNTPWALAIDNGLYASGATRRMRGPTAEHVTYDLFQDAAHQRPWGSAPADQVTGRGRGQSVPWTGVVHGRVPVQGQVRGGAYLDTVTVTLTY